MKKLNRLFLLLFASLLLVVSACSAEEVSDPVKDKQDIGTLIKAFYKINPKTYRFGSFPGTGYSVKKYDELANKFFVVSLFPRESGTKLNPLGRLLLPPQFPIDEGEENFQLKVEAKELPKVKIEAPELDGQRGKVVTKLSDGSLVQFFLQKRPEGWRIYKVRTFTSAPKNLYFLPGLKALEDAYDGDMDEYPSTPNSPSFRTSNQASVTLSPW